MIKAEETLRNMIGGIKKYKDPFEKAEASVDISRAVVMALSRYTEGNLTANSEAVMNSDGTVDPEKTMINLDISLFDLMVLIMAS